MTGEVMLARARAIVGERPYFRPEDWEDQLGAALLAMCERGRRFSPEQAAKAERKRQQFRARVEAPLFGGTTGDGDDFDD